MEINKQEAALSSVLAAVFLTTMKTVVGILTGSLGIISEALHSLLDLFATVITFFAVRFSDKPADSDHNYGHGKMESFSALIETLLLFITCGWIIYEAVGKLFLGKSVELSNVHWGVIIMLVSIIVDTSRVKVLKRAAEHHGSQALEADALHFSSDVWSSSVVAVGLICVWAGERFNIPALKYADPIAALGVALLVIRVSINLGKETVAVLLDTAPKGMKEIIEEQISKVPGVIEVAGIRIRPSGAVQYIDINAGIDPSLNQRGAVAIVHDIREKVMDKIPRCDIVVSTFPVDLLGVSDSDLINALEGVIDQIPDCANVHNVHIYELEGKRKITAHIELKKNLTLSVSHELSHKIGNMIQEAVKDVDSVNIYFEQAEQEVKIEEITETRQDIAASIKRIVGNISDSVDCHDIRLYRNGSKVSTFIHCGVRGEFTVDKLEILSRNIKSELIDNVNGLKNVHIHFEPIDESI